MKKYKRLVKTIERLTDEVAALRQELSTRKASRRRRFYGDRKRIDRAGLILAVVARHYGVGLDELRSPSRVADLAYARHVSMYLLRTDLGLTLAAIAAMLGRKDHTTVIHGVARIANEATIYPKVKADLAALAFAVAVRG